MRKPYAKHKVLDLSLLNYVKLESVYTGFCRVVSPKAPPSSRILSYTKLIATKLSSNRTAFKKCRVCQASTTQQSNTPVTSSIDSIAHNVIIVYVFSPRAVRNMQLPATPSPSPCFRTQNWFAMLLQI